MQLQQPRPDTGAKAFGCETVKCDNDIDNDDDDVGDEEALNQQETTQDRRRATTQAARLCDRLSRGRSYDDFVDLNFLVSRRRRTEKRQLLPWCVSDRRNDYALRPGSGPQSFGTRWHPQ